VPSASRPQAKEFPTASWVNSALDGVALICSEGTPAVETITTWLSGPKPKRHAAEATPVGSVTEAVEVSAPPPLKVFQVRLTPDIGSPPVSRRRTEIIVSSGAPSTPC
jgi:hypothetical protein